MRKGKVEKGEVCKRRFITTNGRIVVGREGGMVLREGDGRIERETGDLRG